MFPKIVSFGRIAIYSYPLFMGLAWGIAYNMSARALYKDGFGRGFNRLFWGVFGSAWIGAKLLFLVASESRLGVTSSFWLGGGFVFYGGLIGAFVYVWVHCHISKAYKIRDLYRIFPAVAIAHGVGRIGCFLAGCCFGVETNSCVGVLLNGISRHPVQLYEAVFLIALGLVLNRIVEKGFRTVFTTYFLSYSLFRFGLEFLRGDSVRGVWGQISTAQIISTLIILLILCEAIWSRYIQKRAIMARRL